MLIASKQIANYVYQKDANGYPGVQVILEKKNNILQVLSLNPIDEPKPRTAGMMPVPSSIVEKEIRGLIEVYANAPDGQYQVVYGRDERGIMKVQKFGESALAPVINSSINENIQEIDEFEAWYEGVYKPYRASQLEGAITANKAIQEAAPDTPLEIIAMLGPAYLGSISKAAKLGKLGFRDFSRSIQRNIPENRVIHTFDDHAAQWFGRSVNKSTHLNQWRNLINRISVSEKIFPWSTRGTPTIAHLGRVDNKYFVVQFFESGELATAFHPNQAQLTVMLDLLKGL